MKKFDLFLFFVILFISACEDDSTDPKENNNDSFTLIKVTVQNMMITNHEGAIDLANILIDKRHHNSFRMMAQEMINSQTSSIDSGFWYELIDNNLHN